MNSLSDVGDNPEKILQYIEAAKAELRTVSELIKPAAWDNEVARKISGSLDILSHQLNVLESETRYVIEINTCRKIMLTDSIAHIKKLEQQLLELKS
jgi:hypothetical protein